jgi:predicted phage tail protein
MGKLVAVHLHGPLADRFGPLHHFAVQNPREALYALDANYPGFIAAFAEHERYGVLVDDDWREGENAAILPASKEIHFVPAIEGEVPFVALGLTALFPALSATAATIIGSLLVTGLMIGLSLLFRPKKPQTKEAEEMDDSYVFSGPENVSQQGVAVPLIYGRVYAGSVVVSAGQDTVDVATTTPSSGASKPSSGNSSKPAYKKPTYRGGHDGLLRARRDMMTAPITSTKATRGVPVTSKSLRALTSKSAPVAAQMSFVTASAAVVPRQYSVLGVYAVDEGMRSYLYGSPIMAGYMVENPASHVVIEEPYEDWPNLLNDGAGVEHLRPTPVDDWPAIITDPVYGFKPEGWVPVKTIWASEEDYASRKQVLVWQPDYETEDAVYNWNMVRGFYVTELPIVNPGGVPGVLVNIVQEEPEWIAGAEVEIPIQNPAP